MSASKKSSKTKEQANCATNLSEASSNVFFVGKKARPPRGHRQRGAGTVQVDKGPIERDGIIVQSWQRLPLQWIDKQKRPIYQFQNTRPSKPELHRLEIVLPDAKNSSKDLHYCPTESFNTVSEAKEYAALLALMDLQGTLPLEMKLPEPYSTTWKTCQAASKSVALLNSKKPSEKNFKSIKKSNEVSREQVSPEQIIITDNSKVAAEPIVLTTDRKYVSKFEQDQANIVAMKERAERQKHVEAKERYNAPTEVLMSGKCRRMLEDALGLHNVYNSAIHLSQDITIDSLSLVSKTAVTNVISMGFDMCSAIAAAISTEKDQDLDIDSMDDNTREIFSIENSRIRIRLAEILDWLCLHIEESKLPEGYNPAGKNLDVIQPMKKASALDTSDCANKHPLWKYGFEKCEFFENQTGNFSEGKTAASNIAAAACTEIFKILPQQVQFLENLHPAWWSNEAMPTISDSLLAEIATEEISALEAIFGVDHSASPIGITDFSHKFMSVSLGCIPCLGSSESETFVDVFILGNGLYPSPAAPLLLLRNSSISVEKLWNIQMHIVLNVLKMPRGEPIVYDALMWISESLPSLVDVPFRGMYGFPESDKTETILPIQSNTFTSPAVSESHVSFKPKKKNMYCKEGSKFSPIPEKPLKHRCESIVRSAEYGNMKKQRDMLPAARARKELVNMVQRSSVVLVCGETGCGKTTQIPQFLLEAWETGTGPDPFRAIITQPRRIAAMGVATRVAKERGEELGQTVGYAIRGDTCTSDKTQLLFCTTGVLLRRMRTDSVLEGLTHLLIDEVHERHLEGDFLLALLKSIIPKRPLLRIVLMSATIDQNRFSNYFSDVMGHVACPVLSIPGRTFPVRELYLEDIHEIFRRTPHKRFNSSAKYINTPDINSHMMTSDTNDSNVSSNYDDLKSAQDMNLIAELALHVASPECGEELGVEAGAILIFLPGAAEISGLCREIEHLGAGKGIFTVPLHGGISPMEQQKAFKVPPKGRRKIVVSTNIAETSITIPDVTIVIDSCRVKEMGYDASRRIPRLEEVWAARDSLIQRAGRAGRVSSGVSFRLISRKKYQMLPARGVPEIVRMPLESLVLQIKSMKLEEPVGDILSRALDPPLQSTVQDATASLVWLGALDQKNILTPLGWHLSALPCPAQVGKMIVYGAVLGCLRPVLSIAASLLSKSPFLSPRDEEGRVAVLASKRRMSLVAGGRSDHTMLAVAYAEWSLSGHYADQKKFCEANGLSQERMREIHDSRTQLAKATKQLGFDDGMGDVDVNADSWRVVRAAVCAGLAPNIVRIRKPVERFVDLVGVGAVSAAWTAQDFKFFTPGSKIGTEERVFVHPASINFSTWDWSSMWAVYHERIQTTKVFLCDVTEVSPYAILLFGGPIEVQASEGLVIVDGWIRFGAVARIASLIGGLREQIDALLWEKICDPALDISSAQEVNALISLLMTDGMN